MGHSLGFDAPGRKWQVVTLNPVPKCEVGWFGNEIAVEGLYILVKTHDSELLWDQFSRLVESNRPSGGG